MLIFVVVVVVAVVEWRRDGHRWMRGRWGVGGGGRGNEGLPVVV